MKIVPQSVELEWITPDALLVIERATRTCYKSEGLIEPGSAEKLVRKIWEKQHHSCLEHAVASFRVVCDRGVCYSNDTDVLTEGGWKPWPEVRGDERFATLDPNTHSLVYQEAEEIVRIEYEGPMYLLQTSMINLCVTPEHKVYVQKHDTQAARRKEEPWQLIPVKEIVGKRVSYKRDCNPVNTGVNSFTIPDFITTQGSRWGKETEHTRKGKTYSSIPFSRFLGYWTAEGSLSHSDGSGYHVELYQNRGPVLNDIVSVLREMGYEPSLSNNCSEWNQRVRVSDAALYSWLSPYHGAINKRVPREFIDTFESAALNNFLDCYIAGDGSTHKNNGHQQGYTISKGLADDLQEIALKVGISATIWVDDRVGKTGGIQGIVNRHPCYVISFVTGKNTPLVNTGAKTFRGEPNEQWVDYSGMVYCVTVPNHTLYVRRNGRPCWSGNSHELVRHRIMSFSQESTRYCNYSKEKFGNEITVIEPPFDDPGDREEWFSAMRNAEKVYLWMIGRKVSPQIARSVLPNSLKTELVATANFREWLHFLKLRTSKAAHPQMREVALMIEEILIKECPEVFTLMDNE